jgi:wyosine [tRNA(Phe)-imidazoG37] synthetase (radical SAM superfamily)
MLEEDIEIMIAFGPVPSRRLGRSLGINNIPYKVCTYSCVYCQVGKTRQLELERRNYYKPQKIYEEVSKKIDKVYKKNEPIDYLTFVPDGEPTLDANLGREIDLLKPLGLKIAVITNASIISREDVKEDLAQADLISAKIDSTREKSWHKINRPHRRLQLRSILKGISDFAKAYKGRLITESMLVQKLNDNPAILVEIGEILARLNPACAYLAMPTRPPAESWVKAPGAKTLNSAFQIIKEKFKSLEYLIVSEGDNFSFTGNIEKDLLSITAVHPMNESALIRLLAESGKKWTIIQNLIDRGQIAQVDYKGTKYYLRCFR